MDDIRVEESQGVVTIWLNAPERRNAFGPGMMGRLADIIEQLDEDDCRLILVRGAGNSFCAGRALPAEGDRPADPEQRLAEALRLATAMHRCRKPLVAIVEGYAIGVGLSLALWCDFAIAEAGAQFSTPEVRLGFPPTMTAVTLLRRIPRPYALDFLLTGRRFDAEEALAAGVIRAVVPAGAMEAAIASLIAGFEKTDTGATAAFKALLRETESMGFEEAMAAAASTSLKAEATGAKS
jgi:Enoyl-CoA hydratase/carnithine racemase